MALQIVVKLYNVMWTQEPLHIIFVSAACRNIQSICQHKTCFWRFRLILSQLFQYLSLPRNSVASPEFIGYAYGGTCSEKQETEPHKLHNECNDQNMFSVSDILICGKPVAAVSGPSPRGNTNIYILHAWFTSLNWNSIAWSFRVISPLHVCRKSTLPHILAFILAITHVWPHFQLF